MAYLFSFICMILAACTCVVSYMGVDKRLRDSELVAEKPEDDSDETDTSASDIKSDAEADASKDEGMLVQEDDCTSEETEKISLIERVKQVFATDTLSRWIVFALAVLLTGCLCYFVQSFTWGGFGLNVIGKVKYSLTTLLLMAAAVTDFYTKKIPNMVSVLFLASGIVLLIWEFFCMRETFGLLLGSSLVGLIGGFLILFVMALVTRGGIGMGDVKLISTMSFVTGISCSFYTFFFSSILCAVFTIVFLLTKKKTMKDDMPFGPFIFISYILVIILGLF